MSIRVLVADDHLVVRQGIRGLIEEEEGIELVGEAANGEEAVRLVGLWEPDVVLMDLRMPVLDGADATARIRTGQPDVNVLVLTTYDSDAEVLRAVEAGATGYLLKDASREDLLEGIRQAAEGKAVLAPTVASRVLDKLRAPAAPALSLREIEVLELLRAGQANRQIARALHISEATVKTHLIHIFSKLGVENRTEAVAVALDRGILPAVR